jgi:hypothetical protein
MFALNMIDASEFAATCESDLIFSQLTQGNSRTNIDYTPLCLELLNLGKRFFHLDCKVREHLYLGNNNNNTHYYFIFISFGHVSFVYYNNHVGLHRVVRRNPMAMIVIAGQLYAHMSLYVIDNGSHSQIKYESIFEFSPLKEKKALVKVCSYIEIIF